MTPNAPHEGPGAASSPTFPLDAVVGGLRVRLDVRCSATDTKRQIAITKGAQCLGALWVDGDVGALEAGGTVCRLKPLASAGATRPSAHFGQRRCDLGLRQAADSASVGLHVEAGSLDQHKRAGVVALAGYGANSAAASGQGVGIEPPLAAEIDDKAATIVVCHGRRSLLGFAQQFGVPADEDAARLIGVGHLVNHDADRAIVAKADITGVVRLVVVADVLADEALFGDGEVAHFGLLTPDPARCRLRVLRYSSSCIIHIKQHNARTICKIFEGGSRPPT